MSVDAPEDPADPIAYFVEDMEYHGKAVRTRRNYERVLRRFESYLTDRRASATLATASHRDCMAWVHSLRGSVEGGTVATYAAYLHRFYAYMVQIGVFDANPMTLVVEEMDEEIETNPTRRDIDLASMRAFVCDVRHPLHRALVTTLLKTGMRVGEVCNLDFRDLRLDGDLGGTELGGRPQLDGRPDSIYVDDAPSLGDQLNGVERIASNKRKRATIVPVDDELRRVLVRWLAVRPDSQSPADPLFVGTAEGWGERLTPESVRHIVRTHARERGWHRKGGDASENVTPHYFRHFFTTHLRDRTGDRGIVKYLRGDVASDVIDTYTHNWGDRVRDTYEDNIYRLFDSS